MVAFPKALPTKGGPGHKRSAEQPEAGPEGVSAAN